MKQLKSLWAEFKGFAFKGSMIDLAVAVVIGAAVSGVVNSLVKDIIMPVISYATTAVEDVEGLAKKAVGEGDTGSRADGGAAEPTAPVTLPATVDQAIAANETATEEWREMVSAFATALAIQAAAEKKVADAARAAADAKAAQSKPFDFTWKLGRLDLGNFVTSLINFCIIAFAIFIVIVKLVGGAVQRVSSPAEPGAATTKECPECLSIIAIKASRCPNCTSSLPVTSGGQAV